MSEQHYKKEFSKITTLPYVDQAKWFLNGFWKQGMQDEAEKIWGFAHYFMELDPKKKAGSDLDEFWSHKFLEHYGETLTVVAMRERLRQIDLDSNGRMSLVEYLGTTYNKTVQDIVDSPQGDNSAELAVAKEKLDQAQSALESVKSKIAEVEKSTEENAAKKATLAEQEAILLKAEEELKAAVDDLKQQEDAFNSKIAELEAKVADVNLSTVQHSKAVNELATTKAEDPMPLRRAKITQEAALRKVEKSRKETAAARDAVAKALEELEKLQVELKQAEQESNQKVQEAEEYLEYIKKKGGVAEGAIWWMQRELTEQKKYIPKSKGGIDKK